MEQWQYEIILGLRGEAQEEEEDEEEQHLFCVVNEFKIGKGETSVERPESSVKSHYIPLSLPLSLSFSLFRISSLLRLRAARPQRCSTMPRQRPRNQHPWRRSKSCRTLQWNSQQQNSTNTTSGDSGDSSHKFCSMQCPRQTFAELNSRRLHRADPSDVYCWPNFIKLFKTIPYHVQGSRSTQEVFDACKIRPPSLSKGNEKKHHHTRLSARNWNHFRFYVQAVKAASY